MKAKKVIFDEKDFEEASKGYPEVIVEVPSKVTVPDLELKISLFVQLPATLILLLSEETSSVPSVIVSAPSTFKLASRVAIMSDPMFIVAGFPEIIGLVLVRP